MQKNRALIFDIDGTAIDSPTQKLPSERLKAATRALEGEYYLCAASGRTWATGGPVFKGMGLVDPCIIAGGTQICNPVTGEILWQCNISPENVKAIRQILLDHPTHRLIINNFTDDEYLSGGLPVQDVDLDQTVHFMVYTYVPLDVAVSIANSVNALPDVICLLATSQKNGLKDVHITSSVATKEHAVAELLDRLGVRRTDTWGFGDALNDIHLFNAVNVKVAMGNSIQELKDQANEVIAPVSEDGLARYFERLAATK
jgi:HAD superfamily hydrolase (TIGR01484 family)